MQHRNNDIGQRWRRAFFETVQQDQNATRLREASLNGQLEAWTTTLTEVVVSTCQGMGWQASAKGHRLKRLPCRCSGKSIWLWM
jgi:hypothetical protein